MVLRDTCSRAEDGLGKSDTSAKIGCPRNVGVDGKEAAKATIDSQEGNHRTPNIMV